MSPGDICMQVNDNGRQVRKVKVVELLSVAAGGHLVMVEALYGPLRSDRYPIAVENLVPVDVAS